MQVVLSRKQEVERLEQEGEEGMIHSLLSGLPDLYDQDDPSQQNMVEPGPESIDPSSTAREGNHDGSVENTPEVDESRDSSVDLSDAEETAVSDEDTLPLQEDDTAVDSTVVSEIETRPSSPKISEVDHKAPIETDLDPSLNQLEMANPADEPCRRQEHDIPKTAGSTAVPGTHTPPTRLVHGRTSSSSSDLPLKPHVSLSVLLERTDELYSLYPPTHPSINLQSIMGPQSVMFTWSAKFSELPSDDGAELMVTQPQLVVLPAPEELDSKEKEEDDAGKIVKRRRRKLRKPMRLGPVLVERRAVVASAVLVLGVAMAVYGMQGAPERHHGASKELRKLTRYVGGLVLGMSGKLWDGLVAARSR